MSESIVLRQPWPSPRPPYELDEQPPPCNNFDVNTIGAPENPEETEDQRKQRLKEEARRRRDNAEDCCCDCDDDADCCCLCLKVFCNPCRLLCRALAECTDECCDCCADNIHGCCDAEPSTEVPNGGGGRNFDGGYSPNGNDGGCDGDNNYEGSDCDCDCNLCD